MAASLLTVGLGQTQTIPVLSNQRVSDVMRQMGKRGAVSGTDALDVGRRAGATYVVVGYIYRTDPRYVIGAEVASTADGSVLTSCRVEAPGGEHGLFAAVDTLTVALRHGLAKAGFGVRDVPVNLAGQTTHNPAAYRAYLRGIDLLAHDRKPSIEALEEAVRTDSTFALAWYYLAVARWWNEDFEGAKQAIDTPLRLGDRLVGREREALGAIRALVQGRYADGASEYRALLARYPDDKEFFYGLGEALYHEGSDPDGAQAALERALELHPTFAVAFQHLADLNLERGRFDRAIADVERFRRSNPASPVANYYWLETLARAGRVEEMISAARNVLAANTTFGIAPYRLGNYFRMVGEFDSAKVYYDQIPPGRHPGIFMPVDLYLLMSQGRWAEAERLARKRAGRSSEAPASIEDQQVMFALVRILIHEKKHDEAWERIQLLRDSHMATHPSTAAPLEMAGIYAVRMGRMADAEEELRRYDVFLRQNPLTSERRTRDGLAMEIALARGDAREAKRLLPIAGSGGPHEIRDLFTDYSRARALLLLGNRRGATETLERIVKRAAHAADPLVMFPIMLELARRYEQDGRKEEALSLYRRLAHQFRMAEPGLPELQAARAGIARIERARAQTAATR